MTGVSLAEAAKALGEEEGRKFRRLMERGVKIPPQPRVLEELRQCIRRKEQDVRVLARVINQDPGATAMLFKVVTNAAYAQHQPFDSVEQILHAVGIRQTVNLMQAIVLAGLVKVDKNQAAYEAFWARSQAVAQIAMLIADDRVAVCNIFPDQAYLAGIFHDCGVLLLLQRFPAYCAEMHLGEPGRWVDLDEEDRKFSADHSVVGYIVSRYWRLPEFICDAIRLHHHITEMGDHEARSMIAILQLAIEIYYRDQHVPNPEWARIKDEVMPELGLGDDTLPEFVDIVIERFHASQH
ncbi:HDOD domain-containing protein [Dechloromonas sp. ZS-1]|uniref:HDOD domain-containing protein n=1 Tax=Dechloromonas sp. ZS-1 TaxID=3138067 RepID=UPI0031FD86CB